MQSSGNSRGVSTHMDFDIEKIKQLIDLMNANDLQEMEVQDEGKKIRLRKTEEREVVAIPTAAMPVAAVPEAALAKMALTDDDRFRIPSPMVGTFYRAPDPDAEPFVGEGDRIQKDSVICIIEAMKVMNEIRAEVDGTVEEILVANGEAVEYGQPLFVVKRDPTE
ncbi:MAG: acetyl-CoA carboxylase biotin carboxyl carrier protein [Planctomycetota bacterium]|nr:acetyl-CoA carboxylase biotin carboxyl carrier protein [Planctomycetota bacterium]